MNNEIKQSDWEPVPHMSHNGIEFFRNKNSPWMIRCGPMPSGKEFHKQMGNHSHLHPRIKLDMRRLTMDVLGRYEIDLETMDSPAELLDMWLQVSNKTWCDDALVGEFFHAIEDACQRNFDESTQGVFCPFWKALKVNWKKKTFLNP